MTRGFEGSWKEIGKDLGITVPMLSSIQEAYEADSSGANSRMLLYWIENDKNAKIADLEDAIKRIQGRYK